MTHDDETELQLVYDDLERLRKSYILLSESHGRLRTSHAILLAAAKDLMASMNLAGSVEYGSSAARTFSTAIAKTEQAG